MTSGIDVETLPFSLFLETILLETDGIDVDEAG